MTFIAGSSLRCTPFSETRKKSEENVRASKIGEVVNISRYPCTYFMMCLGDASVQVQSRISFGSLLFCRKAFGACDDSGTG